MICVSRALPVMLLGEQEPASERVSARAPGMEGPMGPAAAVVTVLVRVPRALAREPGAKVLVSVPDQGS